MSWFKKTLARVGFGSASVSAALDDGTLKQGGKAGVTIMVTGGEVAQQVNAVHCSLRCHYMGWEEIRTGGEQGKKRQWKKLTHTLSSWSLPDAFALSENETRTLTTEVFVPRETPVTFGNENVWLEVSLDIPMAKDANTTLPLTIAPSSALESSLNAFESLGFRIEKETTEQPKKGRHPFEQVFTLAPINAPYNAHWSSLTMVASADDGTLSLSLRFAIKGEGLAHMAGHLTGANKLDRTLSFPADSAPDAIAQSIEELLGKIT